MKDVDILLNRVAELERLVRHGTKMGSVHEVGKKKDDRVGWYRVNWGKGADGKPIIGPWQRLGSDHGFANEHTPLIKGQTVVGQQMGGDYQNSSIRPFAQSDNNPMPKDASENKRTFRIRKPVEDDEDKGGSEEAGEVKADKPYEAKKREDDDKKDLIQRTDYDGHYRKKGKVSSLIGQPSAETDDKGKRKENTQPERVFHQYEDPDNPDNNSSFHFAEGKLVIKHGKTTHTYSKDGLEMDFDGHKISMTKDGTTFKEGKVKHDSKSIGKDHKHLGVQSGSAKTGDPDDA